MKPSRRAILRAAGTTLALPLFSSWPPRRGLAADDARPPLRMAIYTVAGGTVIEHWKPERPGRLDELPTILEPLAPFKDRMLLVSGLAHGGRATGCAHATCARLHLSCGGDVSVDQAAARVAGGDTLLPSLEIGLTNHQTRFSYRDGTPLPFEMNPHLVFTRMFGGRPPVVPDWKARAAAARPDAPPPPAPDTAEQSVLDTVLEQARDLRAGLDTADRRTLDGYLHAVRAVEKQLAFVEARRREAADGVEAAVPEFPPRGRFGDYTNPWMIWRRPDLHAEYIRVMSDLLVLAFQTDTTRVVTAALGEDNALFPGVVTAGTEFQAHALEHNGNAPGNQKPNAEARIGCRQIHTWYTALFAEMVAKLAALPEGEGTLLDHCMILYTSYMADGGHGVIDYPTLLVGGAAGTLATGRHVAYPVGTPVANLYVEMLDRMGAKPRSFGDSHTAEKQAFDGRLPGLS
jgi:hypothetical protein